jgi:tetratricopeptide (TPR) repeat protein
LGFMDRRTYKVGLVCIFLVCATLGAYWRILDSDFVNIDDPMYVTDNRQVQSGLSWQGIWWAFTTGYASNWHPVTWLSHMLDCQLFGVRAGPHHLINVLLHIVNTLLLFVVLERMTKALWPSAFVAAVFALHPLHVESVAWVAERKDVLSSLFWLLTMLAYVGYVERPKLTRYLLALAFFVVGLMAKPMLVTLPFVLVLLDFWPLARIRLGATAGGISQADDSEMAAAQKSILYVVVEKIPFLVFSAISSTVTFIVQQQSGAVPTVAAIGLTSRVNNAITSYVAYIGKMVWPANLAVLYPYAGWKLSLGSVIVCALMLVLICVFTIRAGRRHRFLAVGWLWYVGTLVPVIGLVHVGVQAMADRYTYIPLIGLFIIIAWGAVEVAARWRVPVAVPAIIGVLCLSALTIRTWRQVSYWVNSKTLFNHALGVTTDNHIAHNNLGNALIKEGKTDEAILHYRTAIAIQPRYADAHNNLGNALQLQGSFDEAISHHREALQIKPRFAEAHANLGMALRSVGKPDEAIEHYRQALRIKADYSLAHFGLAFLLQSQGNTEEAISHYRKALEIKPNFAEGHSYLGNALRSQGKTQEAITHYRRALELKPDYAQVHNNLGNALRSLHKVDEAIKHYHQALRIDPDYAQAHNNLGTLLSIRGESDEAIKHFHRALQLDGDFAEAHCNLGMVLRSQGKLEAAAKHYREALRINPGNRTAREGLKAILAKQNQTRP